MRGKANHPELRTLNPRETKFVHAYAACGNGVTAYKQAGYTCQIDGKDMPYLAQRVYSITHRPKIQRALALIENERARRKAAKADFTLDWWRAEMIRLAKVAEDAGDLTNAVRCQENIGKSMGVLRDNVSIDAGGARALSEVERAEALRLAGLLLADDQSERKADAKHVESVALPALPAPDSQPDDPLDALGDDFACALQPVPDTLIDDDGQCSAGVAQGIEPDASQDTVTPCDIDPLTTNQFHPAAADGGEQTPGDIPSTQVEQYPVVAAAEIDSRGDPITPQAAGGRDTIPSSPLYPALGVDLPQEPFA